MTPEQAIEAIDYEEDMNWHSELPDSTLGYLLMFAREAAEKQIRKEPITESVENRSVDKCPTCKMWIRNTKSKEPHPRYCPSCGQALKRDLSEKGSSENGQNDIPR